MSHARSESLERRWLLSEITSTGNGVSMRPVYHGDTNLDYTVDVVDLHAVATNYGKLTGARWQDGDFNYDGKVNFDDLLAMATNFWSDGTVTFAMTDIFKDDWLRATSLVDGQPPSHAYLVRDELIVRIGRDPNGMTELASRVSSNGRLRVFAYNSLNPNNAEVISIRASKVNSIRLVDSVLPNNIRVGAMLRQTTILLSAGDDKLIADDASQTIYAGPGDDTIYAGRGDDVVYGDEGVDRLFGEGGNDTLFGGAHKDFLNGGSGKNILVGGSGTDYFTVRPKDKIDREPRDHVTVLS